MKHKLLVVILCAFVLSTAGMVSVQALSNPSNLFQYGTDYDTYPTYKAKTVDSQGFAILTKDARYCKLENGVAYRVVENVTIEPSKGDYGAGFVANNNLIYINAGCTLTVRGSDGDSGWNRTPGLPGIVLREGYSLCIVGEGSLVAYGGRAGSGGNAGDAGDPIRIGDTIYSGNGGNGGYGGGGAGAGIGTAGSYGGMFGSGGYRTTAKCTGRSDAVDVNGNNGEAGGTAGQIENPGQLAIAGNVTVTAVGGSAGDHAGKGGKQGRFLKETSSIITKHLTGGSGGGGGGAAGGQANGIGQGGMGGSAGGGGGSAGCVWLSRHATSSDTPPTASGGEGAYAFFYGAYGQAGTGAGGITTRGSNNTHGGEGGKSTRTTGTPSEETIQCVTVYGRAVNTLSSQSWRRVNTKFTPVDHYTGLSKVPNNASWYIQNPLYNAGGQKTETAYFATVAGVTTVTDVTNMLSSFTPTSATGMTFKGWALTNDKGEPDLTKIVYDATTRSLNATVLEGAHKITMTSLYEGVWMCPTATSLAAIWETPGYSIEYDMNGGTLVDSTGKDSGLKSYTQSGLPFGKEATLYTADNIGPYKLVAPKNMPAGTKLVGWTTELDPEGYAEGSLFKPGASTGELQPKKGNTVKLYAVWKERTG